MNPNFVTAYDQNPARLALLVKKPHRRPRTVMVRVLITLGVTIVCVAKYISV